MAYAYTITQDTVARADCADDAAVTPDVLLAYSDLEDGGNLPVRATVAEAQVDERG